MQARGQLARSRSEDRPEFKNSGWKLVPQRAFKNTEPEILAKLDPLPELARKDYKEYLTKKKIPFHFWQGV